MIKMTEPDNFTDEPEKRQDEMGYLETVSALLQHY
jgi:hypothetical protein